MKKIEETTKTCRVCFESRPIDQFTKNRPNTSSRKNICKFCCSIRNKNYRSKNKEKIKLYAKTYIQKNKKRLKRSKKEWYERNKTRILDVHKKYTKNNKEKINAYQKDYNRKHPIKVKRRRSEYRKTHKNQINIKATEWKKNNAERLVALQRNYYKRNSTRINRLRRKKNKMNSIAINIKRRKYARDNKEKINQKRREYYKNHREEILKKRNAVDFRIISVLRSRLRESLFIQKAVKLERTMNLVGCSIKKLKKHLESKFVNGMTWNNYGFYGWHIDHIRPCSSFNLLNLIGQKRCFHYTNLQPLWGSDNLSKNSLYKGKRIRRHYCS